MRNTVIICFGAGLLAMAGCAPIISGAMNATVTEEQIVADTASYFGVEPGVVEISNIKDETLATSYRARYRGTLYNCRIYYGEVECRQPGA